MITKHFFKTLIIFSGMIILGLVGVFLVGHFDKKLGEKKVGLDKNTTEIAK